jgi:hypothetical protein
VSKRWVLTTVIPKSRTPAQANCIKANVSVILSLYKYRHAQDLSAPTIIIADEESQVYAAVVRTYYDKDLKKTGMVTTIQSLSRLSEFKALEDLYRLSRTAIERAILLSKSAEGFKNWADLDLSGDDGHWSGILLNIASLQRQGGNGDHVS